MATRSTYYISKQSFLAFSFALLYLAHTLRNLTLIYMLFLLLFYFFLIVRYLHVPSTITNRQVFLSYMVFFIITIYVSILSFAYSGFAILQGVPRLFMAPLFAFLLFPLIKSDIYVRKLLNIYNFVFIVGVLSFIYQLIFGPVFWFNVPGASRGGLDRFATSLGSLTIYGTSCGIALLYVITIYKGTRIVKLIFEILFVIGAALSMQKAAFINIILALFISLFFFHRRKFALYVAGLTLIALTAYAILSVYRNSVLAIYVEGILLNTVGNTLFSDAVLQQDDALTAYKVMERLTMLVQDVIVNHDLYQALTIGIGIVGGGGGMGVDGPQAHNTFWDLLLMGGPLYLLSFFFLFYFVQKSLLFKFGEIDRFLYYANYIFLINFFGSSAQLYHPITSFVFWVSVSYVLRFNCRNTKIPWQYRQSRVYHSMSKLYD